MVVRCEIFNSANLREAAAAFHSSCNKQSVEGETWNSVCPRVISTMYSYV